MIVTSTILFVISLSVSTSLLTHLITRGICLIRDRRLRKIEKGTVQN